MLLESGLKKTLLFLSLFLLLVTPALAHNIKVSAYVQDGTIHVAGLYPDDRPVANGRVLVEDSAGDELLKGRTDEKGAFRFPIPKFDTLKITVSDMLGHRTTVKLRKSVVAAGQD